MSCGEDLGKVGKVILFVSIFLLACLLLADVIAIPICLCSSSCLAYRQFDGGKGEQNYCILYPEDDDMEFSFDHGRDNILRSDSAAYLLAPPFSMYKRVREFSASFTDDFYSYHYMFPGDSVKVSGQCTSSGGCHVEVITKYNSCSSKWNKTLFDYGNLNPTSVVGKSSSNKCSYRYRIVESRELDEPGPFNFWATPISYEGPTYVTVNHGLFGSATGNIKFTLYQTQINVSASKIVSKCNDYTKYCTFGNLSQSGRMKTYLAVNEFGDNMASDAKYEIDGYYHPSKKLNQWIAIGFAIATGAVFVIFVFGGLLMGIGKVIENADSGSNANDNKAVQPYSDTPGGADDHSNDPVDPAPNYAL